jgi:hypothetical protein
MTRRILAVTLLCAAFACVPAHAEEDAVQFFSNIHVEPDATVHDAVCFFCSVDLEGKATGDVVVFFGNTHITSDAQHDVVNFFGSVTADDNANIGHDLVSIFGSIRLGENVRVGEDLVAMFGSLRAADSVSVEGSRVVEPAILFFGPLIFFVVVFILIVREFRAYRRRVWMRAYQFPPRP